MAWQLVKSERLNQSYKGKAEKCTYTFTVNLPDQLGTRWTAEQSLDAHIEELAKQNSIILEYKLWEDKEPTWTTDYRVELVASASPLRWNLIIIGVLALLALIAVSWTIHEVKDIAEYSPAAVPLLALALIAIATVVGVYLVRRKT